MGCCVSNEYQTLEFDYNDPNKPTSSRSLFKEGDLNNHELQKDENNTSNNINKNHSNNTKHNNEKDSNNSSDKNDPVILFVEG